MIGTGVYIEKDLEIVITEKYMITYRRNSRLDLLESRLFRKTGQSYLCIGVCQSSPIETEQMRIPKQWETAFIHNGNIFTCCQRLQENASSEEGLPPQYSKESDGRMKVYIDSSIIIISEDEKITVEFEDGGIYSAIIDEVFSDETLQPKLPNICNENISDCLRLWNMGIKEEFLDIGGISTFIGVTINTSKHMYIFEITPNSIYCRAARFVATSKGVVFNQNFRQGFEAYMIKNNNDASLPLSIDESLFFSDSCIWNDRSVYWSLASYNDTEIILNGCQGDIYHWKKPENAIPINGN